MLVVVEVGDQVVDDAAGRVVAAQRVLRLARARSCRRSLVSVALTYSAAPGPDDHRLAEVADVEDADGLADGGVLLDDAGRVLQRHRPAAELGELRAEGDVAVVQGRLLERRVGHGAKPTAARCGVPASPNLPRVTTYTLRSASPAKTRADAVVVGVVAGRQGPAALRRGRGRRQGLRPQAAPLPVDAGRHRQGRRGGQGAHAATRSTRRCWSSSASATTRPTRSPYAAPPASPPAASPTPPRSRSPCPPTRPSWSRAVTEGYRLGGYTFTALQDDEDARPPSRPTSSCSAAIARRRRGGRRLRGGAGRSPTPSR